MLNCQFSILVCFYSVAKWKEHSVTKVNGNPPQSKVNFLENYFFSATKQREMNQKTNKKQKTNTLTQDKVNGTRRFTRVCRFLLHHGSRLSRMHCNPNNEFFQRRYNGVTDPSVTGDYFWLGLTYMEGGLLQADYWGYFWLIQWPKTSLTIWV